MFFPQPELFFTRNKKKSSFYMKICILFQILPIICSLKLQIIHFLHFSEKFDGCDLTILFWIFQIHFQKITISGKQVIITIYNIVLSGIMAWYKIWILYELLPGIFYGQHRKSGWYSVKSSHFHFLYPEMIFFSQEFNWFHLFSSENCFLKVAGHGQNRSKMTILTGGVDGFCYFSLIFIDFIF